MDDNKTYTQPDEKEENEGLDIMAMVRSLWDGRKTIFITLGIFFVLGLVAAFSMKRTYSVQTIMVPQVGNTAKSGLGGLAALAGFDMGASSTNGELSPLLYPQIVSSVPFRLELMHTPLHYEKCDTMISMLDYAVSGYDKPSVFSYILKYTIGLPGTIMSAFRSNDDPSEKMLLKAGKDNATDNNNNNGCKPVVLTLNEVKMMPAMAKVITLNVDKKEGYITLIVNGSEPVQTVELAIKAQQMLQDAITRFRIEKSQSDLEYIQARYDEAKEESDRLQVMLASATDKSQNVTTTSAKVGNARIQAKYNIANAVFLDLAKQLEQAKMKVKQDTPAFSVIQPITLPSQPANSRAKTLIIWIFLGVVVGCGIVIAKSYWPKVKGMFKKKE